MIDKFIETLSQAKLWMTPIEIAEALLLAMRVPLTDASVEEPSLAMPSEVEPRPPARPPRQAQPSESPMPASGSSPREPSLSQPGDLSKGEGGAEAAATPFRAPRARALPGASQIARALRPLNRRVPSRRRRVIDEEKTVKFIADSNGRVKTAVMRPAPERWLDVALVLDESRSMHVWRPTLAELRKLLERHGAFGRVRAWYLNADEPKAELFREPASPGARRGQCRPEHLLDPLGRRLLIVVSDCMATAWREGHAYQLLNEWSRSASLALAQVLPQRLWIGTTMTEVDAALRAPLRGAPNRHLRVEPRWNQDVVEQGGAAIPVITLDERSIHSWAQMIAGAATACGMIIPDLSQKLRTSADAFSSDQSARKSQSENHDSSADARLRHFRATASPMAQQLAGYLASAPLSLPVMHLVQQVMLPQSRQIHLAEIFRSRLVKQEPENPDADAPDDLIHDFHDGVRDKLIGAVERRETLRVMSEVEAYIDSRLGLDEEFDAKLSTLNGESRYLGRAFARLSARTLRRLGGYDELADRLNVLADRLEEPTPGESKNGQAATAKAKTATASSLPAITASHSSFEKFKQWQTYEARIKEITDAGATVVIDGVDYRIQRSEISYRRMTPQSALLKPGESIQVVVTAVDPYSQQLSLSHKQLQPGSIIELTDFTFNTATLDQQGKPAAREQRTARQFVEDLGEGARLEMVEIPGGKFMMGTAWNDNQTLRNEHNRYWNGPNLSPEMPQHEVTIGPFFMGKFTITQKQWRAVAAWPRILSDVDPNPSHSWRDGRHFHAADRPVEKISWNHAIEFCARLADETGRAYRLPTEAEWEYACRAGTVSPFAFGETISTEFVNYNGAYPFGKAARGNYRKETWQVGGLGKINQSDRLGSANAFGLFDMHGNVWEWCQDLWHDHYRNAPNDGTAWEGDREPIFRVARGGSYNDGAFLCRSASRNYSYQTNAYINYGFRVVVSAASNGDPQDSYA